MWAREHGAQCYSNACEGAAKDGPFEVLVAREWMPLGYE